MDSFEPSYERAAALDCRMRSRLADSLAYIFAEVGEELGVDAWSAERLITSVRAAPQSPQVFGACYDLVLALEGDRLKDALQAAAQIVEERPTFTFRISKLQDRPTDERTLRLLLGGPLPNMSKIFAAATPFARTLG